MLGAASAAGSAPEAVALCKGRRGAGGTEPGATTASGRNGAIDEGAAAASGAAAAGEEATSNEGRGSLAGGLEGFEGGGGIDAMLGGRSRDG
jgi:hypothetical protein